MCDPLLLRGLDGANPLGFLAALGTLVAAQRLPATSDIAVSWTQERGTWRPRIHLGTPATADRFVVELDTVLRKRIGQQAFAIADDLTITIDEFHRLALDAAETSDPGDREFVDYLAAYGSDGVEAKLNGKPNGLIADTAFRTMSGAGHQHFLGTMRALIADTTATHLKKTLFDPWAYDDPIEKHTMRWDPIDDVRYALRWRDSSGDPERRRTGCMWAANRLAIEALKLFTTIPTAHGLATTGFTNHKGHGLNWTWPIWDGALGIDTVRSLLALAELREATLNRQQLLARGIVDVYRSTRFTQGKFRNFGVAFSV